MMKKLDRISPITVFIIEIALVAMCAFICPSMAHSTQEGYQKEWKCPYCHHHWKYGESCKNSDCPTNQWEKNEDCSTNDSED